MSSTLEQLERDSRQATLAKIPPLSPSLLAILALSSFLFVPFALVTSPFVPLIGFLLSIFNLVLGLYYLYLRHSPAAWFICLVSGAASLVLCILISGALKSKIEIVMYYMLAVGTAFQIAFAIFVAMSIWRLYEPRQH